MSEKERPAGEPAMTFETFVVGSANRLAAAAARRTCESPGTAYNPLFLYSAAGLGKTHILHAIGALTEELHPGHVVRYRTLPAYLEEVAKAAGQGKHDAAVKEYLDVGLLLLDDIQAVAGEVEAQEGLLRTLDALTERGAQVVLASDRPPAEIDGLDVRLLSRFSGGLIVDMGEPDYETRVGIVRREAESKGWALVDGVSEAVARFPLRNVRDLQRALAGVVAFQERSGQPVTVEDVPRLMSDLLKKSGPSAKKVGAQGVENSAPAGKPAARPPAASQRGPAPGRQTVASGPGAPAAPASTPAAAARPAASASDKAPGPNAPTPEAAEPPKGGGKGEPWRKRIYRAADIARAEHVSAVKLVRLLDQPEPPPDWEEIVQRFESQLERIRDIRRELKELGDPWPQAAATLLTNPDRLDESESLLASARELRRSFAALSEGPGIRGLGGRYPALAVKAAEQLIRGAPSTYNPLYVHSPDAGRSVALLEAVGRTYLEANPGARVGFTSLPDFATEFVNAIQTGVAGAWRERWWALELLLLHGVQDLSRVERLQDEVFHLFDALIRAGGRILVAGDRPPSRIEGVDERLEEKFEGGLVVDLGAEPARAAPRVTAKTERGTTGATAPSGTKDSAPSADRVKTETTAGSAPRSTTERRTGADRQEPGIPWPPPHFDASTTPPPPGTAAKGTRPAAPRSTPTSTPSPAKAPEPPAAPRAPVERKGPITTPPPKAPGADDLAALKELVGVVHVASERPKPGGASVHEHATVAAVGGAAGRGWTPSAEKAVLDWPDVEDRIAEAPVRHAEVPDGHRG